MNARTLDIGFRTHYVVGVSIENAHTISAYNKHVAQFNMAVNWPITGRLQRWIDDFLQAIPRDAQILEIGSGSGRDAAYIEHKGFSVNRSDASVGFVQELRQRSHSAHVFNPIHAPAKKKYAAIFANAVFIHFTEDDTVRAMQNIHDSLEKGGTLAFSTRYGNINKMRRGRTIPQERFYRFLKMRDIEETLLAHSFLIHSLDLSEEDGRMWARVIAKKN